MEQGYTIMSNTNANSLRMDGFVTVPPLPVVSYANDGHNYLTITNAGSLPQSSGSINRKHDEGSFPRVDSGFESASSSPLSGEDTAVANNASSSAYEYINPRDLYLHPLPLTKSSEESDSSARTQATVTTTTACCFPNTDFDDSPHCQTGTRQRSNPVYHSVQTSDTRVHTKQSQLTQQMRLQKQVRCLWIAVVILIFVTVFILALSVYTLSGAVADLHSRLHGKDKRIKSLESEFLTLSKQIKLMNYIQTGNASYLPEKSGGASYIMEAQSYFAKSLDNLTSQLQTINLTLHRQLQNISLIPGPQGPPGAGNLSLCQFRRLTSSVAVGGGNSSTSYVPNPGDLENNIVMSVACDVRGGNQQSVEVNILSGNKLQYRCRCDGEKPGESHRDCTIHYLLCPRFS